MENYDMKIKEKCRLYHVNPDVLTDNDKERLIKEIKASEKGCLICHSVLNDVIMRNPYKARN